MSLQVRIFFAAVSYYCAKLCGKKVTAQFSLLHRFCPKL